ncbi:MAG TPA: hypothetical protein DF282_20280 [Hyphomonas sp.]|nr:hypothetical protein [Hyphomonas sp.]
MGADQNNRARETRIADTGKGDKQFACEVGVQLVTLSRMMLGELYRFGKVWCACRGGVGVLSGQHSIKETS